MEYTFRGFLANSVKKNRITFIILAALTVLSVVIALVGASQFTYAAFSFSIVAAAVCFIGVFITTIFHYYRAIHKSGIAAFVKPLAVIFGAIGSNILLCAIILIFSLSSLISAAASLENDIDKTEIAEEQETDTDSDTGLIDLYIDFQNALIEKGYGSISYFLAFAFYVAVMYINTLSLIICAISFAKLFRRRTLFGSILGFFFFDTIGSFVLNILTSITAKAAQGVTAVAENINNFYSAAYNISDPITALKNSIAQLPYASDFVKLYIFSALCTVICTISFILASKAIISKDMTQALNSGNKNNI